jgi:PAS domain S-box-containing protein
MVRAGRIRLMTLFAAVLSFILLAYGPCAGVGQAQPQRALGEKNILILHTYESNLPLNELVDRGLSATLELGGIGSRSHFFEYLDLLRNPGAEHTKQLVEMLRLRYARRNVDLIITTFPEALQFVLNEGRSIFRDVPILALFLPPDFRIPETNRRIIAHRIRLDMAGTLKLALKLVPGTKSVYVVNGVHVRDKGLENQARRDFKEWEGKLDFRYLTDMSMEDVLATVSSAPPGTIIFFITMFADSTGKGYNASDAVRRMREVSTVPIFGLYDTALGHGIVGGSLASFERIGTKAGQLALEILGISQGLENTAAVLDVPPIPMFDWRELRHWNLNVDALPEGSIVVNKELTLWDFRYYIIGALAFCLTESALVVILIAQRRRRSVAEKSLRKAEQKYRAIFDGALEGIYETSPQGQSLTANPALARMLGYDSPDDVTSAITDSAKQVWVNPSERAEYIRLLEKQDVVRGFECQFRRKDGTKIWVSLNTRRVFGPDGKTLFYSGFIEDITERKRAEEALRASERQLRLIADSLPVLISYIDRRRRYRFNNLAYAKWFGISRDALTGAPVREVLGDTAYEAVRGYMDRALAGEEVEFETELSTRDGPGRYVQALYVPHVDERGGVLGFYALVHDITEHRRVDLEIQRQRDELAHVSRVSTLGELTASLAHEIHQPLAAIMSNAQAALRFLAQDEPDFQEVRDILQDIVADDRRANEVIQRLRLLLRRARPELASLALNELIGDVLTLLKWEVFLRGITVEVELDADLPPVVGDRVQLQQVILNLVLNAADAMAEREPGYRGLIIRTEREDEARVRVAVRDFGTGLDGQNLHRLFEPFYSTKPEGLGMGLAISRSIVEAHGGRLWAANNPDRGATFMFTIPISPRGEA